MDILDFNGLSPGLPRFVEMMSLVGNKRHLAQVWVKDKVTHWLMERPPGPVDVNLTSAQTRVT